MHMCLLALSCNIHNGRVAYMNFMASKELNTIFLQQLLFRHFIIIIAKLMSPPPPFCISITVTNLLHSITPYPLLHKPVLWAGLEPVVWPLRAQAARWWRCRPAYLGTRSAGPPAQVSPSQWSSRGTAKKIDLHIPHHIHLTLIFSAEDSLERSFATVSFWPYENGFVSMVWALKRNRT